MQHQPMVESDRKPVTSSRLRVLVVSEDPAFIAEAQEEMTFHGVEVVACLGPAHTTCPLEEHGVCPMAEKVSVVIVDSPRSGAFVRHWKVIPAGDYAERLALAYPDSFIVLAGAPQGRSGGTGDVSIVRDRRGVMELLRWLAYIPRPKVPGNGHGR